MSEYLYTVSAYLKTALIFEDFEPIAEIWKMILQGMGYTVTGIISNPEEDMSSFSDKTPDLVLLDINLKGNMSGFQVAEVLLNQKKDVNIIFVTMFAQQNYLKKAFSTGAKGYVVKNAPISELKNAISAVEKGENYVCQQMRNSSFL